MSLLSRAKLSGRIRLSSLYSIASLQQLNSYSTSKTPKLQKSPASSSIFSERIKKTTGGVVIWPKPSEIPYQAKVANFVNLVGYVKAPIQFETASDGKHFAATVLCQELGNSKLLPIPVVFEGDLAHVVALHVKENDFVLVSGQMSSEQVRFALIDGFGKFHVVAENLHFVEVPWDKRVGIKKPGDGKVVVDDFDPRWIEALENAKVKNFSSEKDSNVGIGEAKKNEGDRILNLWRDLVKNSLLWLDYRDHKAKGLVKEKFPDFKHKETGDAVWIGSAPKWVLPGLGKLEFDKPVTVTKSKPVQGGEWGGKDEDSWKNLVENPNKWWDNRTNKRNPKAPDFKHKDTGKGLWISSSPDWALPRLPPLNGC